MTYEDAIDEHFGQASIYIDACFILAYMDSNDPRGDKVCEILQKWHNEGVTKLGISTHVFGEVVHNLFIQEILLPLEIHHKNQSNLRSKSRHNHHLGESEESVSFLYNVWKKQMPSFYKKNVFINISELIKFVKMNYPSKRNKLQIFYNNSIDRYNEFLSALRQHFHIEFLTTDVYIQDLALAQMRLLQLEAYDALHYAIATYHHYDYFATLNGDFVHTLYNQDPDPASITKIIKIA
ncbi:PIN domain-containing protein [Geobacillus stearothermophilus]